MSAQPSLPDDQVPPDTQNHHVVGRHLHPVDHIPLENQFVAVNGDPSTGDQASRDTQCSPVAGSLPVDHADSDTHGSGVNGDSSTGDQGGLDTHSIHVAGSLPVDHTGLETQTSTVSGDSFTGDQHSFDAQADHVAGSLPADHACSNTQRLNVNGDSSAGDQPRRDTQCLLVAGVPSAQPTNALSETNEFASGRADALLAVYAAALDDFEDVRIRTQNRVRDLNQRGWENTPEHAKLGAVVDGVVTLEHQVELQLRRAMRSHPLGPWVKRTIGIGEKQGARLLAAIGDPAERRTVSQLWAYCGYHVLPVSHSPCDTQSVRADGPPHPANQVVLDTHQTDVGRDPSSDTGHRILDTQTGSAGVAPKRKRGQQANWNGEARKRAWLIAESCMKQRSSPYREVYDKGRIKYADSVHTVPCPQCGPAGKPAQPGSPLSDGHKHARALRLVAKAMLRDLWVEAKSLTDQAPLDTQETDVSQ